MSSGEFSLLQVAHQSVSHTVTTRPSDIILFFPIILIIVTTLLAVQWPWSVCHYQSSTETSAAGCQLARTHLQWSAVQLQWSLTDNQSQRTEPSSSSSSCTSACSLLGFTSLNSSQIIPVWRQLSFVQCSNTARSNQIKSKCLFNEQLFERNCELEKAAQGKCCPVRSIGLRA